MAFWVNRKGSNAVACCYPLVRHRLRQTTNSLQPPTCWPHCWPTKASAAHRHCNEDPPSGNQLFPSLFSGFLLVAELVVVVFDRRQTNFSSDNQQDSSELQTANMAVNRNSLSECQHSTETHEHGRLASPHRHTPGPAAAAARNRENGCKWRHIRQ